MIFSFLYKNFRKFLLVFLFLIWSNSLITAQTTPPEGIRQNTPGVHAFINARIVVSPGRTIEKGTVVIRDGVIEAVGVNIIPPKDARVWDLKGKTLYPGLFDSYTELGMPKQPRPAFGPEGFPSFSRPAELERGPAYWNDLVLAQQNAFELFSPDSGLATKLRSQGVTTALVVPTKGIFKGTSALVNLGEGKTSDLIVKDEVASHLTLETDFGREAYPGSLMGVIALIRQVFLDAEWYKKAWGAYSKNPRLTRLETNEALAKLSDIVDKKLPVIIEASDELNFLRAQKIAKEFSLPLIVRGSGYEYRRLEAIKRTGAPVILPVNFPEPPSVQTPEEALNVSLKELKDWDQAPENPKRLQEAKIEFALTSALLKDSQNFLAQVRKAVERGLSKEAALAALTTVPAKLFGVENKSGTIEAGKVANLVVTDGELFTEKTKIIETWVDGRRYEVSPEPTVDPRGKWELKLSSGQTENDTITLNIKGELTALEGTITKRKEVKLSNLLLSGYQLSFSFEGDSIGYKGVVRMTGNVAEKEILGNGEWSDGTMFTWTAVRMATFIPEPDTSKPEPPQMATFPVVYPEGAFGRSKLPEQVENLLVKNATIWTCGPQGKVENGDLLINKGKITKVGKNLVAPTGAKIIDARGKHITPGIIDCHSHTAVSGDVNESGQAITSEVRIGDVINCDEIAIYRELAGGVTTANVLHGSANPIGGQNQVIKLRWGALPEEMKFQQAPPGIKFALGENVKQSNWGDRYTTRYPQTRMGVEQIIRDDFKAALDYEKTWNEYSKNKSIIPPRKDLELEALLEILKGKRLVHAHSYRQDEILMLLRLAEEFGFKVTTLQHILEGYKVADVIAKHGAGASSFSDWWAYKLEVYDAIPYSGALMYEAGVVVSFNSDSDEMARRLNTEAAKAVKYGGVSEEEALKFVTLNPAKQLRIDKYVGSLEPGKDADFAIWNTHPLSTLAVCEQTWIEGRKYFDRSEDQKLREEAQRQKAELVQKILKTKKPKDKFPSDFMPKKWPGLENAPQEEKP